jgi:hypothetical protein
MKTEAEMSIIFRSLKRDPMGHCFTSLGADGVLRVWHSDSFELMDAARLSTAQIKNYLDRLPFDQAKEDEFRGKDGLSVPDENLFNPPEEIRPKRPPPELVEKVQRLFEERQRKGIKMDSIALCKLGKRSNYNLDLI